jgi:hypothetical protein
MALDMAEASSPGEWVGQWAKHIAALKGENPVRIEIECQTAAEALIADVAGGRLPGRQTAMDIAKAADAAGLPSAAEFVFPLFGFDPPRAGRKEGYVDNGRDAAKQTTEQQPPRIIKPRAFVFRDPTQIAPRPFIMGTHYIRRYVSATIAPGGLGKSALVTCEQLALVTGRMILGAAPRTPKRSWYIGEDDQEELDRRFLAAMKYYSIKPADCGDRLFVESFRDTKLVIAEQRAGGVQVNLPEVEAMIAALKEARIDVLTLDPFVKTHRVSENDNGAMEATYAAWVDIAEKANVAVELVVHSRKSIAGQAKSVEDARGASSQIGAVRDARLIIRMTEEEATTMGIEPEQAFRHIRVGDTKANMTPHPDSVRWLKLESVSLANATDAENADNQKPDSVQVVTEFKAPTLFDGISWQAIDAAMRILGSKPHRASPQANDWAGHAIGVILDIDTRDKGGKRRMLRMLDAWLASGALVLEQQHDEARRPRDYILLGNWTFITHGTVEDWD